MRALRVKLTTAVLIAVGLLGLMASPVAAIHQNAVVDCGTYGTYVLQTTTTGAGLYPPSFVQVDLLTLDGKKVGTLIPFAISIDGVWLAPFAGGAPVEAVGSNVGFATCTFTGANGAYVVMVGLLNLP